MEGISWRRFAEINGLTPDQFTKEILMCAACVGAMELDKEENLPGDVLRFSCEDENGGIVLTIMRVQPRSE